jgi:pyruvate carboxylase
VYLDYVRHRDTYGNVTDLTTPVFFYGLTQGQEIETDLEPGKTLIISMQGLSEPDAKGVRTVFFDLNGFPRAIEVTDRSVSSGVKARPQADPTSEKQIGAAMPGKVLSVAAQPGQTVKTGDTLLVTESMKMEYVIKAKAAGTVKRVTVAAGDMVEGGDLLVELG